MSIDWTYELVEKAFLNYLQNKGDIVGLMQQLDTTSTLHAYEELCNVLEVYLTDDEISKLEEE